MLCDDCRETAPCSTTTVRVICDRCSKITYTDMRRILLNMLNDETHFEKRALIRAAHSAMETLVYEYEDEKD